MNSTNYDILFQNEIKSLSSSGHRPRLLLHVCCAPCASVTLERTTPSFDVTAFYYNPNISPYEELTKRADAFAPLLRLYDDAKLIIPSQEVDPFASLPPELASAPEGGERCKECFLLRLGEAARYAAANGFDYFCSSLTVGPMKNSALINAVGLELQSLFGVKWLCSDFKKRGGYARSVELSRELGIYRQNYCGCRYSFPK